MITLHTHFEYYRGDQWEVGDTSAWQGYGQPSRWQDWLVHRLGSRHFGLLSGVRGQPPDGAQVLALPFDQAPFVFTPQTCELKDGVSHSAFGYATAGQSDYFGFGYMTASRLEEYPCWDTPCLVDGMTRPLKEHPDFHDLRSKLGLFLEMGASQLGVTDEAHLRLILYYD